jgi:hypothetical protein
MEDMKITVKYFILSIYITISIKVFIAYETINLYVKHGIFLIRRDTFVSVPEENRFVSVPEANRFVSAPEENRFVSVPEKNRFVSLPETNRFVQQTELVVWAWSMGEDHT